MSEWVNVCVCVRVCVWGGGGHCVCVWGGGGGGGVGGGEEGALYCRINVSECGSNDAVVHWHIFINIKYLI